MKKLVSLLLLASISLCFLSGCIINNFPPNNHIPKKDTYRFEDIEIGGIVNYLESDVCKVSVRITSTENKFELAENRYSSREEDIANFLAIIDQTFVKVDNLPAFPYYYEYKFYKSTEIGSAGLLLDFYHKSPNSDIVPLGFYDTTIYTFKDDGYVLPTIENPEFVTYSFTDNDYQNKYTVKKYNNESVNWGYSPDSIECVEFIPYEGEADEFDTRFYLDSPYGVIELLGPTLFKWEGKYYRIVVGADCWVYTTKDLKSKYYIDDYS